MRRAISIGGADDREARLLQKRADIVGDVWHTPNRI
jgi:hypothetical protein